MSNHPKTILLIAYRFPPAGGVGARRWSKFTKYLARDGWTVHVLTPVFPFKDAMTWSDDVRHPRILVHRIPVKHPAWMLKNDQSFLERILSRIYRRWIRPQWIDIADGWAEKLVPAAGDLIRKAGIPVVVVTGPPSSLHFAGALIKSENPNIRLIQDYRDPWNSDRDYRLGRAIRKAAEKERSLRMEMTALNLADRIVTVSCEMKRNLSALDPRLSAKIEVVTNGFDREDFPKTPTRQDPQAVLVYTGLMGYGKKGRAAALLLLTRALQDLEDPWLTEHLRIRLYSNLTRDVFRGESINKKILGQFEFHPVVPPAELPGILGEAAACLSVNAPEDPHAFGTKIFDYMAAAKPILHISAGGELSDLLIRSGQMVSDYSQASAKRALLKLKDTIRSGKTRVVQFAEFDVKNLIRQYGNILGGTTRGGRQTRGE